jgi:hypothetical protein
MRIYILLYLLFYLGCASPTGTFQKNTKTLNDFKVQTVNGEGGKYDIVKLATIYSDDAQEIINKNVKILQFAKKIKIIGYNKNKEKGLKSANIVKDYYEIELQKYRDKKQMSIKGGINYKPPSKVIIEIDAFEGDSKVETFIICR